MAIILHNELTAFLGTHAKEAFPFALLLYGDAFLYKTALEGILNTIAPSSKRDINVEIIEGTDDNISEVIEKLNTFSLIGGQKIIVFSDAKQFYSKKKADIIIEKARQAHDKQDYQTAARQLLTAFSLLKLSFDDIDADNKNKKLNMAQNKEWIHDIVRHCAENNMKIPADNQNTFFLEQAIAKGFPKGNHLIITADIADKKHGLFKAIADKGMIVDCSVPKSDRTADKKVQESVINEKARAILNKSKKTMGKGAYNALYEMTGFDLWTFTGNLEKLISYIGDRKEITESDVTTVLDRTKTDPIYEFTNAILEKNTDQALFYLSSLLSGGIIEHPLQILSAIINQMRKLLIIKDFTQSKFGKSWYKDCSYDQFRAHVLPGIIEYDNHMAKQIQECSPLSLPSSGGKPIKKTSKKTSQAQNLMIAKNPNNSYPVYKALQHSENFSEHHLIIIYERLSDVDTRLKSSPPSTYKLILEETVLAICQKENIAD